MIGIYSITNITNGKRYIGESLDIEIRWEKHLSDLKNNIHHSYKLQNEWNICGKDNFKFEILEEIIKELSPYKTAMKLIYIEDQYISKYDSINKGYNIENTIDKILSGDKLIMDQDSSEMYMRHLIRYKGVPRSRKQKKKKKDNVIPEDSIGKNCVAIYKELVNEGYVLDFSSTAIYNKLIDQGLFVRLNNSNYVRELYLEQKYFINGKESKNKYGNIYYSILVTEKGKQLIIDVLKLNKNIC